MRTHLIYSSCQVLHGDPDLYSVGSPQGLVDGVAESEGRVSACADTPQALAVSSVCSQEPGRGRHCLSMEGSPFWLSHCQLLAPLAAHLHLQGCLMYPYIDDIFHAQASTSQTARTRDISLHCHFKVSFIINLKKSALVPSQVMLHLGALIDTARGLGFPSPALTETIIHATQDLLGISQISALCLHQVTGLLASFDALVPLCMFCLYPLRNLLIDHFDMRVNRTSKLIPLSSPVIWSTLEFWSRQELVSQGVPLQPLPPTHLLTTYASTYGWGAACAPLRAKGVWSSNESSLHINFLELETVFFASKRFQTWLCGTVAHTSWFRWTAPQ